MSIGIWYLEVLFLGLLAAIALAFLAPLVVGITYTLFAKSTGALSTRQNVTAVEAPSGTRFSLRYAGPSLAVLKPGCEIRFLQVTIPGGLADVHLSSTYLDGWGDIQEPLVASVEGTSEEAANVTDEVAKRLAELLSALSLSANAWIGDLVPAENKGNSNREETLRELDAEATGALLDRIGGFGDANGLWTALADYRMALGLWSHSQKHLALAHLHRGLLTLSESFVTFLAERDGLSRVAIARASGVQPENLATHVLKTEIYRCDGICFHTAQLAWRAALGQDGGEMDSFVIEDSVSTAAAQYFRTAIFRILELEESLQSRLLQAPYDVPLGLGQSLFITRLREERFADRTADFHFEPGMEL